MNIQNRGNSSRIGHGRAVAGLVATLLICSIPIAGYARQSSTDQAQSPDKAAPPPSARPVGDPKTGVVKPPDVDPNMSKPVPDIDPAITQPPPGKPSIPADPGAPKVQPR